MRALLALEVKKCLELAVQALECGRGCSWWGWRDVEVWDLGEGEVAEEGIAICCLIRVDVAKSRA